MKTLIIKTRSRSYYAITRKGDQFHMGQGTKEYVLAQPEQLIKLQIGKPLKLDVYEYNIYGKLDDEKTFIETTPVVSIDLY